MYELEVEHGAAYDSIAILKSTCTLASGLICIDSRVSGGLEFPPPRNLEIEYGYYCGAINISYSILHVTGHKYVSSKCCLESLSQIASEAI